MDETLEDALKRFQARHGLTVDGVLGDKTRAALNVPVEERIDQIRVNLERQRWYLHELEGEFIYKRDPKVLNALRDRFRIRQQDL